MTESRFTVLKVPANETEMFDLLASRAPCWEYLLFGYYLRAGLQRTEVKWRDYTLGYTMSVGPRLGSDDVSAEISDRLSRMTPLVTNIDRIISPRAQETAFGLPGEEGDPDMIQHMADRLIQSYELVLDWADDFRSLRLPGESDLGDMGAQMAAQPLEAVRAFVFDYIAQVEQMMSDLADGKRGLKLQMTIAFKVDDDLTRRVVAETKRLVELS
ncbi:hypothetical protein ABS642_01030 [Microbacterium sp. A8/3-1]|uniref:Uncharacterized protein n=1 Tax=Microbacterium sp. A8/3-1 TaxID=3160749 RepID=A0AAU7VXA7_9MICO